MTPPRSAEEIAREIVASSSAASHVENLAGMSLTGRLVKRITAAIEAERATLTLEAREATDDQATGGGDGG